MRKSPSDLGLFLETLSIAFTTSFPNQGMNLSSTDQIQIISLILEFTGLGLTITETFYPKGNSVMEQWFKLKVEKVNYVWYKYNGPLANTIFILSFVAMATYFCSLLSPNFDQKYGHYLSLLYILLIGSSQFVIIFDVLRPLVAT